MYLINIYYQAIQEICMPLTGGQLNSIKGAKDTMQRGINAYMSETNRQRHGILVCV